MSAQKVSDSHPRIKRIVLMAALGVMFQLGGTTAFSHHSFPGVYDFTKPVKLEGVIRQMEWINPHSLLHFVVEKQDGGTEEWIAEVGTPNALIRAGLTKSSFGNGTKIIVSGYRARDGSNKMNGMSITTADGKPLFQGGDR